MMKKAAPCTHDGRFPARRRRARKGEERADWLYFIWCDECETIVSKDSGFSGVFISLEVLLERFPEETATSLPQRGEGMPARLCGGCGKYTASEQNHHFPQFLDAVLGVDLSGKFPQFWLCNACHMLWHRHVTPGLCTPYDAKLDSRVITARLHNDEAHIAHLTFLLFKGLSLSMQEKLIRRLQSLKNQEAA